ncbi:MAG: hypothetical protein ACI9K2_004412 [Myxococcota bacterium]|jgi:hypothetical protein
MDGRDRVILEGGQLLAGNRLLPMPEAGAGLIRITAEQSAHLPPGFFEGLQAVLVPAQAGPNQVAASESLAVALSSERAGRGLVGVPVWVAAGACGGFAALFAYAIRRVGGMEAIALGAVGTAGALVAVVVARSMGVQLPAMGMMAAAALPAGMMLVRSVLVLGRWRPRVHTPSPGVGQRR